MWVVNKGGGGVRDESETEILNEEQTREED